MGAAGRFVAHILLRWQEERLERAPFGNAAAGSSAVAAAELDSRQDSALTCPEIRSAVVPHRSEAGVCSWVRTQCWGLEQIEVAVEEKYELVKGCVADHGTDMLEQQTIALDH